VTALAILVLNQVSVKRFRKETSVSMESLFLAEIDG
jgi:hypothetical protein